jgi:hypothetical protein
MAASVLNSPKAIEVSVFVTRAFVQQRAMLMAHADLAVKLERLEKKLLAGIQLLHEHDDRLDAGEVKIDALIEAIRELHALPDAPRRPIGFRSADSEEE